MPAARAIVATALRKLGRVGGGRDPRPADLVDGMEALKSLYRSWINEGAFGRLVDVVPEGNYIALGNERIYRRDGQDFEVTLPELVVHGDEQRRYYGTIVTVTQPEQGVVNVEVTPSQPLVRRVATPRDLSVVVISDHDGGETADFIYDGTLKKWVSLWNIAQEDDAPLSFRDSNGLASCLAVSISDQWGADVAPATLQAARAFMYALVTRFNAPRCPVRGVYF